MKKIAYIISIFLLSASLNLSAQPHPEVNGDGSGVGNNPVPGGGAPIGGGVMVMMGMAAFYAWRKHTSGLEHDEN